MSQLADESISQLADESISKLANWQIDKLANFCTFTNKELTMERGIYGLISLFLIEPVSMPTMPSIALMAVVLPAPLGPTKPVTRPVGTVMSRGPRVKVPCLRTTASRRTALAGAGRAASAGAGLFIPSRPASRRPASSRSIAEPDRKSVV